MVSSTFRLFNKWLLLWCLVVTAISLHTPLSFLHATASPSSSPQARAQLRNSSIYYQNVSILSLDWTVAVAQLDFDQDLYLTSGLLCPFANLSCPPPSPSCQPCDWTRPAPAAAPSLADCCAFHPADPAFADPANVAEWLSPATPFERLSLDPSSPLPLSLRSSLRTLNASDTAYFRFLLPDAFRCAPLRITARQRYGNTFLYLSNRWALPSVSAADAAATFLIETYGFAQSFLDLCPTYHPSYSPGTWALAAYADIPSEFYIEIYVATPQPYPLPLPLSSPPPPPPPNASSSIPLPLSCADNPWPDTNITCVDNGHTVLQYFDLNPLGDAPYHGFTMPVPSGCHTLTASVFPVYADGLDLGTDLDLFCINLPPGSPFAPKEDTLQGRFRTGPDTITFTGCFDQPTFVNCNVQAWIPGQGLFTWSTAADVRLTPVTDFAPYDFSILAGFSSAQLTFWSAPSSMLTLDWSVACSAAWPVLPSQDPLFLFPPPPMARVSTPFETLYLQPPPDSAYQLSLPRANRVTLVLVLQSPVPPDVTPFTLEEFFSNGTIALTTLANAAGLPPALPQNSPVGLPYVPHILISSMDVDEPASFCAAATFEPITEIALALQKDLSAANTLQSTYQYKYDLDVVVNALSFHSCLEYFSSFLDSSVSPGYDLTKGCIFDPNEPAYLSDPCCSSPLLAITCCYNRFEPANLLRLDFPSNDTLDWCQHPACATTYLQDLADSITLLHQNTACQEYSFTSLATEAAFISEIVRNCRQEVGYGLDFAGNSCHLDQDCPFPPYQCDFSNKRCRIPPLSQTEDRFLQCFIEKMPVSFEDWLRHFILVSIDKKIDRNSSVFFNATKAAATLNDCISQQSFDFESRNRWIWDSDYDSCKATILNMSINDIEAIHKACPAISCLDETCYVPAEQCYRFCGAHWFFASVDETECSNQTTCTTLPASSCPLSFEGTYTCAYCPPDGTLPCQIIPGPTNEAECQAATVCETPTGEVVFGLTADQCRTQNPRCSIECEVTTCKSHREYLGICEFPSLTTEAQCNAGVSQPEFVQGVCFSVAFNEAKACQAASADAIWHTCEALPSCDYATPSGTALQCYNSPWGPCPSESACKQATLCSDRPYAHTFDPETGVFSAGACSSSGFYQVWIPDDSTNCQIQQLRTPSGCQSHEISQDSCSGLLHTVGDATYQWLNWQQPAQTEAQCLISRGCLIPAVREYRTLWRSDEDCLQCGGTPMQNWEWQNGVWITGVLRSAEWVESKTVNVYSWSPVLSFNTISGWIRSYVEYRASFAIRSTGLCKFDLVEAPLGWLSCDCLGDSGCRIQSSRMRKYAIARPCYTETLQITTPSASILFYPTTVPSGCASATISEIPQSSFAVPASVQSISLQLAIPSQPSSVVQNRDGKQVGDLVSNGVIISFSEIENPQEFRICISINMLAVNGSSYTVPDFAAYQDSSPNVLVPLGISLEIINNQAEELWCGNVSFPTHRLTANFFAVMRDQLYLDKSYQPYSSQSIALSYALGGIFSGTLLITILLALWLMIRSPKFYVYFLAVPCFICLCIFRIVYSFALPSNTWVSNQFAGFVIFELPTFFYFSMLCCILLSFLDVLICFIPKIKQPARYSVYVFLGIVWCLFIAVVVADSSLSESSSPCPGRVPATTNDAALRNLAIAYQSILTAFTVLLVCFILGVFSLILRSTAAAHQDLASALSSLRELIKDSVLVSFGFLIRCILFIIYWSTNLESSLYVFLTILCTEVIVIFFCFGFWIPRLIRQYNFSTHESTPSVKLSDLWGLGRSSHKNSGVDRSSI